MRANAVRHEALSGNSRRALPFEELRAVLPEVVERRELLVAGDDQIEQLDQLITEEARNAPARRSQRRACSA